MFNKFSMGTIIAFWVIIALIGIYILCYTLGKYRNPDKYYDQNGKVRTVQKNLFGLTIAGIVVLLFGAGVTHHYVKQATNYGAIYEGKQVNHLSLGNFIKQPWLNMKYGSYKTSRAVSFTQRLPKKNQRNYLILLYRFNCPVCHDIKPAFEKEIIKNKLQDSTYYVESRSPLGKQLVKKYGIRVVPELIYVDKHNQVLASQMYTKPDKHGHGQLNKESLKYYMHLVKANNKK